MTFPTLLADGFRAARRHPRLVLIAYLAPLVPALLLVAMARSTIAPAFDYSLLAQKVLDGSWSGVWNDFSSSPADHMSVILGSGLMLMLLLTALIQIPVAAGTVEVLLEGDIAQPHPFLSGVVQHTWRFARAAVWFAIAGLLVAGAVGGTVAGFYKLSERNTDARLDLVGWGVAALVLVLTLAVFKPAYDLTRLATARHGDRKTLRGFFRAMWTVLRHPAIFLTLFVSLVLLIIGLHLVYYAARSPWTPATAVAILAVFLAQQVVMALRAVIQVSFWGAELAAYRRLDEPRLCEKRRRGLIIIDEPARDQAPTAEPEIIEPAPAWHQPELAPKLPAPEPPPAPTTDDVFLTPPPTHPLTPA